MRFTVISTGYAPPPKAKAKCIASVRAQLQCEVDHVVIDASLQDPPRDHFPNLIDALAKLPPDRVVASLDLDDWLGPPTALSTVAKYYAAGAMVTYGSFMFADGRRGFARAYAPTENVRKVPWRGTHLKTFRAGLFQKIKHEDFQDESGKWLPYARDLALMFPLLEMAGYDRTAFIPEPIYVYNYATSTEFNATPGVLAEEKRLVALVRSRKPYERTS